MFGVAPIVEKMMKNRLKWFGQAEGINVDSVVRRIDQMDKSQTVRGRGKPWKTIKEIILKKILRLTI